MVTLTVLQLFRASVCLNHYSVNKLNIRFDKVNLYEVDNNEPL